MGAPGKSSQVFGPVPEAAAATILFAPEGFVDNTRRICNIVKAVSSFGRASANSALLAESICPKPSSSYIRAKSRQTNPAIFWNCREKQQTGSG